MNIPTQTHVINGESVAPQSGQYLDLIDPSTGELIGRAAAGDAADVDRAVAAAKQAFATWKDTSTSERARIIARIALVLGANLEELLAMEASCTGLSVKRLMSFDIPGVMQFIQTFAENLEDYPLVEYPPVRNIPEAHDVKIVKQPLGVCGLIPAWNGPLFLAFVKTLPAIAAGNTVVIKPAETASLAVVRAVELLQEIVPPGVINVVTGNGHEAGAALAAHPDVAKISFTGSTNTGRLIQKTAAESLKRVTLELGGKGPGIVLPDASIELTARGATLAFLQVPGFENGLFVQPTIFTDVTPDMRIYQEEIFGPVLSVIRYADVEEAIAMANDSCYGLSAGIWTGDPIAAQPLAHRLEAGTVWINDWHAITGDMSFGGTKQSGYGREINIASMEAYLETKNYMTSFETDPGAKAIFGLVHRKV